MLRAEYIALGGYIHSIRIPRNSVRGASDDWAIVVTHALMSVPDFMLKVLGKPDPCDVIRNYMEAVLDLYSGKVVRPVALSGLLANLISVTPQANITKDKYSTFTPLCKGCDVFEAFDKRYRLASGISRTLRVGLTAADAKLSDQTHNVDVDGNSLVIVLEGECYLSQLDRVLTMKDGRKFMAVAFIMAYDNESSWTYEGWYVTVCVRRRVREVTSPAMCNVVLGSQGSLTINTTRPGKGEGFVHPVVAIYCHITD